MADCDGEPVLLVLPLHELARDGGLEWAASAGFSRGVPDETPAQRPLVQVSKVLAVFRATGCRGTAWFEVAAGAYGEEGSHRSIADVTDDASLQEVRTFKKGREGRRQAIGEHGLSWALLWVIGGEPPCRRQ